MIFAPLAGHGNPLTNINWRLIPATGIMALALGGLEKMTPGFAVGLGGLVLLSVLILPMGKASTPIDNLVSVFIEGK